MALLFIDSFAGRDVPAKWDASSLVFQYGNTTPRLTGGTWAQMGFGQNNIYKSLPASSKVIMGFGLYATGGAYAVFYGDAGATTHITIYRNANGYIEIRRGTISGTLLATSSTTIAPSVWRYVEISVTVSDTVGEVHVRLDGSQSDFVSYVGDTKNAGTATTIDRVAIVTSTNDTRVTDVYILNDTGASNNNFLGDVGIKPLSPNGNGTTTQLTGSDGNQTDNYLLVDERPFSATDYAGSATIGHKDTYQIENLPTNTTNIFGVQVSASMVKSDAGAASARTVLRSGSTDYAGTTRALSTSSLTYTDLYEQNPATASTWTVSDANSIEAGMEVV